MLLIRIFLVTILISTIISYKFDSFEVDTRRYDSIPANKVLKMKIRQTNQKGPIFLKKKKPTESGIISN